METFQYFCPLCGRRACHAFGAPCKTCRMMAQLQRKPGRCALDDCFYCHEKQTVVYVDHVVPIARGGPEIPENRVYACWNCNSSKSDQLPSEWSPANAVAVELENEVIRASGCTLFPRMRNRRLLNGPSEETLLAVLGSVQVLMEAITVLSRETTMSGIGRKMWKAIDKIQLLRIACTDEINRQHGCL